MRSKSLSPRVYAVGSRRPIAAAKRRAEAQASSRMSQTAFSSTPSMRRRFAKCSVPLTPTPTKPTRTVSISPAAATAGSPAAIPAVARPAPPSAAAAPRPAPSLRKSLRPLFGFMEYAPGWRRVRPGGPFYETTRSGGTGDRGIPLGVSRSPVIRPAAGGLEPTPPTPGGAGPLRDGKHPAIRCGVVATGRVRACPCWAHRGRRDAVRRPDCTRPVRHRRPPAPAVALQVPSAPRPTATGRAYPTAQSSIGMYGASE